MKRTINTFAFSLFITICLALTGCSTSSDTNQTANLITIPDAPDQDSTVTDNNAQVELAESSISVSKSLQQLAEIEAANSKKTTLPPPENPSKIGMAQVTSIDWTGPIEPLLIRIAKVSHYKLHIIGAKPSIPVIVSITASNTPMANILRDAKFQSQKQVTIALYPRKRILELRYLPA